MANLNTRAMELKGVQGNQPKHERLPTVMAFFMFGTLSYATYSLVIASTQDILAGTFIQTSMVLVANIGPYFIVTLSAPYFMQKIPYFVRITVVYLAGMSGFLILALVKQVHWKLIGVGIASFGVGVSETTFLALTSFYHEVTSTAFSAGTGVGFVIAPLYYTAMTTWICVSPNVTILIMTAMLLLMFVCYYAMDKKHLESPSPPTDEYGGVQYTALDTNADEKSDDSSKDDDINTEAAHLSWREKFRVFSQMLPSLIPLYIAWFSEYMIIQSVITTLAFPNASFKPRDHYQYYIFVVMGGEVVGRSYLVILSYIKAEWVEKAKFLYFWILSTIEVLLLLFFILSAWYRFLPSVWLVLLLLFACGAVIGVLYVNALIFFRDAFEERYKEFVMGYIVVAQGVGMFTAALLGLYTEPLLLEHCTEFVSNSEFCFTRSMSLDEFTSPCLA